ncbi:ubiquitin-like domain-containing protein [Nonomuraea sp. H19]|uniref:ubiquitin-like domain-containing protein n=1 Tax=Nonomuraea sp. H19 TaxID=3452206 RepID=UPI003F8BDEF9
MGAAAVGVLVVVSSLAKDVTVVVDGRPMAVRSFAGSVREVLGDAGVSLSSGDVVRPAAQATVSDGSRIEVRRARLIRLTVDGRTTTHMVTSTRVGDALAELDIAPAAGKISAPRDGAVPLSGMELTVYTRRSVYVVAGSTRLTSRTTARTVREVLRQKDIAVRPGYQVNPPLDSFPEDGTVITVRPPHTTPIQPDVAGLDWPALAECETDGNPEAYDPDGPYYGMYAFSLRMWQTAGGAGLPSDWPEEEQTYRAQLLYQQLGGRWQSQWPACGAHLYN